MQHYRENLDNHTSSRKSHKNMTSGSSQDSYHQVGAGNPVAVQISENAILPFRNILYTDGVSVDPNQEIYEDYVRNWQSFPKRDSTDPRFIFYKNLKGVTSGGGIALTPDHLKGFLERRKVYKNKLYKGEYDRGIVNLSNFHFNAAHDDVLLDRLKTDKKFTDGRKYHKFVTWNVHSFSGPCLNAKFTKDGIIAEFGHNESTVKIADFLRELDPDVCVMQEFGANVRVDGAPAEGGKNRYPLRGFYDIYNSKTTPQLSTTTKKPFIDQQYTILDTPILDRYNDLHLFNALFTKFPVSNKESFIFPSKRQYIKSTMRMDGNDVEVYNIHPESENHTKGANAKDIKSLADSFSDTDTYDKMIIIAGDFNCTHTMNPQDLVTGDDVTRPYENPHIYLKKKNFYNIYDILNHGRSEYDFTGYNGTIIDYMYVSVKFLNTYQIDFEIINTNLSDHYPVMMYMSPRELTKNYPLRTIKGFTDFAKTKEEFEKIFSDVSIDVINTNFFLMSDFIKHYGYDIITIPKGSLFCHSTKYVNFNGTDVPWEYTEHLERTTGEKDFNPNEKSTVSVMYVSESFSSYYGYVAPNAMARMIYFRTKHDVSFIKLSGDTVKERINIRMAFYKRLIEWIVDHNPKLKSHYISYYRSPWDYQKIIQMFMSNLLSKIYEYEDEQDYCNVPCGILIADVINDEATKFSKSSRSILGQWYWDKGQCELYEGLEFQWYAWQYHLEYIGTDYLGNIYVPDLEHPDPILEIMYKDGVAIGSDVKSIRDLETLASGIDDKTPFISMSGNMSTYNVAILMLRRLKECYENMFEVSYYARLERTHAEVNLDWFRHVFHPADERMDFAHKFFPITLLNLNINDFFIVLLNAKFFYRKASEICTMCDPLTSYNMDELEIDFTNDQNKKVTPILIVFYQHVIKFYKLMRDNIKKKSEASGRRSIMLDAFDYMYAMTNMAIQFGIANSYLNIPILTIFKIVGDIKYRMSNGEVINQDIKRSVDVIVRFLGKDFIAKIMKQKRIQLVRYDLPPIDEVSMNQLVIGEADADKWYPESDIDEEEGEDDEVDDQRFGQNASSSYPSRFEQPVKHAKPERLAVDESRGDGEELTPPLRLVGKNIEPINLDNFKQLDAIFDKIENARKTMDIDLFDRYASSGDGMTDQVEVMRKQQIDKDLRNPTTSKPGLLKKKIESSPSPVNPQTPSAVDKGDKTKHSGVTTTAHTARTRKGEDLDMGSKQPVRSGDKEVSAVRK